MIINTLMHFPHCAQAQNIRQDSKYFSHIQHFICELYLQSLHLQFEFLGELL